MNRFFFAAALCLGLLAAEGALAATCPQNAPKPTTVDGIKVKKGSCGPFMMKVDENYDTSNAYYECTDAKGKTLKAHYNGCKQLNAKKPKKSAN